MSSTWIERAAPPSAPRLRLLCFPYAGGTASAFRPWCEELDDIDVCAVQLPGRQRRVAEDPLRRVDAAVSSLAADLDEYLDVPLALFGDCTGAFLAFELCRVLRRTGRPLPVHVFVSCCRAPRLPRRHAPIHGLDEEPLRRHLRTLTVVSPWLLTNAAAFRQFLPVLRADFEMAETYQPAPEPPLGVPITAFAGTNDRVTSVDEVEAWVAETTHPLRVVVLEGGHDLTRSQLVPILDHVRQSSMVAQEFP